MEEDLSSKIPKKEYEFCSRLIWGGVPVDKKWAIGTKIYQIESKRILEKYPLLDKSFHEEWERTKRS